MFNERLYDAYSPVVHLGNSPMMVFMIIILIQIIYKESISMNHYIYLIKEREFIKTCENVYKIGKTTQETLGRYKQYPKGSELLIHIKCHDCHLIEKQLISLFKTKYKQRKDVGREYFEGDHINMIKCIIMMIYLTDVPDVVPCIDNEEPEKEKVSENIITADNVKPGFEFVKMFLEHEFSGNTNWKSEPLNSRIFRFVMSDLNAKYNERMHGIKSEDVSFRKQLELIGINQKQHRTYSGGSNGIKWCVVLHPTEVEKSVRGYMGNNYFKINL